MTAYACSTVLTVLASSALCQETRSTHAITATRHVDVTIAGGDVSGRLDRATTLLGTKDRPNDVACCVRLQMSGQLGSFGTAGDGEDVITTRAEMRRVLAIRPQRIKIVRSIVVCRSDENPGNILGCANTPGDSIVITRRAAADVWAHEFGHNQGLSHRDSSRRNIMHSTAANTDTVNAAECRRFRSGGTLGGACPVTVAASAVDLSPAAIARTLAVPPTGVTARPSAPARAPARAAELVKPSEVVLRAEDERLPIAVPLWPGRTTVIQVSFVSSRYYRVGVYLPEDENRGYTWIGNVDAPLSDVWRVSGYQVALVEIEYWNGNAWQSALATLRHRPPPSPDPTQWVAGRTPAEDTDGATVSFTPLNEQR